MRRCTKCILHENLPGIRFDEHGICNFCWEHEPFEPLGRDALMRLVEPAREHDGEHNCVVPISGGRDSSYVLWLAKHELGLRPLAVNYDNEFRNPQAVRNIENACAALNVDLHVVRSKRDIASKFVRSNVRAGIPLGMPTLVGSFCRQCSYGYLSAVYITAEQRKLPLILWGSSSAESTKDMRMLAVDSHARSRFWKLLNPYLYLTEVRALQQRLEFSVPGNPRFARGKPKLRNPAIREASVFDYLEWDRAKIKRTIADELGWQKPEGHISSWRSDCLLHEIVNYCYVQAVGCTMDCIGYCNMIRDGQMDRATALAQEEAACATCGDHVEELLRDQVGLTNKETAKIMAM